MTEGNLRYAEFTSSGNLDMFLNAKKTPIKPMNK